MVGRLRALRDHQLPELRVVVVAEEPPAHALISVVAAELLAPLADCWEAQVFDVGEAAGILAGSALRLPQLPEAERLRVAATQVEIERAFALPTAGGQVAGLRTFRPQLAYVPAELPVSGCVMGTKWTRHGAVPVRLSSVNGARHVYIVGQTGTGKSTLLSTMILSDVRAGLGVGVIDPHMDAGKIVLLNLSTGRLGAADSAFLGSVLVTRIFAAAMSRTNIARDRRRPFALYIDEFQNFTTDAVGMMVSQARKYGLSLVLAHQNLSQLQDSLGQEVLGNVGNMICFRPGAPDAEKLQKYFAPGFSAADLFALPNWHAVWRFVTPHRLLPAFMFETVLDDGAADEAVADEIRRLSRERYGRPRAEVDAEIDARHVKGNKAVKLTLRH